jgi:hypothetical protein
MEKLDKTYTSSKNCVILIHVTVQDRRQQMHKIYLGPIIYVYIGDLRDNFKIKFGVYNKLIYREKNEFS